MVGIAAAGWLGAAVSRPVPVAVLVAATVAGIAGVLRDARRPWLALGCVALALGTVTSALGARSLAGLHPVETGAHEGAVTLVTDPAITDRGRLRVDVRLHGRRLLAEARTPAAIDALRHRLAGERVLVRGEVTAFEHRMGWAEARHLAGRLRIEAVDGIGPPAAHAAVANGVRRVLDRGARVLPDRHRSLLAGLTLGDVREQPAELGADFRASGLTHLLAVSGSNVVFVLAVAGPLLRRLRLWPRFAVAVAVVGGFAFLTRLEPSVVRAAAVATVALWASTTGRSSGGVRHLALAVCGLLVVDPLLTRSVGFRLSVAACSGVLLLAGPIVERLPGPRWFREPLGMTIGAQLAVAPVLVPTFGAMPLAALPANVAAVPLAAGLMVWGVTAGLAAGVLGPPAATLLHLPSAVGLRALEAVAAVNAGLPLGHVDLRHVTVLCAGAALATRARWRIVAAALALAVVLVPGAVPVPPGAAPAGWAATVWSDGPVGVVDLHDGASAVEVLDVLRQRRVRVVGLVVVRSPRPQSAEVVRALRARLPVRAVLAPAGSPVDDHLVPPAGLVTRVGGFEVQVPSTAPVLVARIGWARTEAVGGRR